MHSTLIGTETEYALVFQPHNPSSKPTAETLFNCLRQAIGNHVLVAKGTRTGNFTPRYFIENGGCFYFEFDINALFIESGLLEFSTPECLSPIQHLRYKLSQRALLKKSLTHASQLLQNQGYFGHLAIIKNSRDAYGNVYGEQENYQIQQRSKSSKLIYYLLTIVFFLPNLIAALLTNLFILSLLIPALLIDITITIIKAIKEAAHSQDEDSAYLKTLQWVGSLLIPIHNYTTSFLIAPLLWAAYHAYVSPYRKLLTTHLVTRIIYTGCGCIDKGKFFLSEKPLLYNTVVRLYGSLSSKPIFETHNFYKNFVRLLLIFDFGAYREYFSRNQRLQIGLSDSNMADVAEYLRIGTSFLLIEMHKAGKLTKLPQLNNPLKALDEFNSDITLSKSAETNLGKLTALQIQTHYLHAAKDYVSSMPVVNQEYLDIVNLWEKTLEQLSKDPGELFGQIDWITKFHLLEQLDMPLDSYAAKKVDLKYHELDSGYFDQLKAEDLTVSLVSDEEIEQAIKHPPETRASLRSKYIHELLKKPGKVKVGWSHVRYKDKWNKPATIYWLDDYR